MNSIFAYNSPIGRIQFWLTSVALNLTAKLLDLVIDSPDTDDTTQGLTLLAILAVTGFLFFLQFITNNRRMLDLRWSRTQRRVVGTLIIAAMIVAVFFPVANTLLVPVVLMLTFARGDKWRAQKALDKALAATDPAGAQL